MAEENRNGIRYRCFRIKGKFKIDFRNQRYAFDHHTFGFSLRHSKLERHNLIFVNDVLGAQAAETGIFFFQQPASALALNPMEGWRVSQINPFQDHYSTAGLRSIFYGERDITGRQYSRYNYEIEVIKDGFPVRRFLHGDTLYALLILSLVMTVGLCFGGRVRNVTSKPVFWLLQVVFAFLFLIAAEIAFTNQMVKLNNYSFIEAAIKLFSILWWMVGAYFVVIALTRFLYRPLEEKTGHKAPKLVYHSTYFTVFLLAGLGIIAFVYGKTVTSLLATSGVFAAIIGLAIQINISNVFSGIAINIERPFRIGDWVKIGDFDEGRVENITWRSTHIHTRNNNTVSIPNSVAAESSIQNFDYPDNSYVISLPVHVDIAHPRDVVSRIIKEAAESCDWVLKEPEPSVSFRPSDWAAEYCLSIRARNYEKKADYEDEAVQAVWQHLKSAGIEPATKHNEITLLPGVESEKEQGRLNNTMDWQGYDGQTASGRRVNPSSIS
jgi:branched-chain amino acid transport system substrate-binding protein